VGLDVIPQLICPGSCSESLLSLTAQPRSDKKDY
jgi:hypothetical protein